MAFRPGSWSLFGVRLPEFGITEKIQNVIAPNKPLTTQGGSNLFGPPRAQTQPFIAPSKQQTFGDVMKQTGFGQSSPTPTSGDGQPSQPQSQQQQAGPSDQNQLFEPVPTFQEPQYDIGPAMEALSQAEQAAEAEQAAGLKGAEVARTGALGRITSSEQLQAEGLKRQQTQEEQKVTEAQAQQRRGFSEISQQFLGQYGNTGFGQGIRAGLGESIMRNIAGLSTELTKVTDNISFEKNRIVEENKRLQEEIEASFEFQKGNLRANLMRSLAEIGAKRGQLQSDRQQIIQQSINDYIDTVREVNSRNTSFRQEMFLRNQQIAQNADKAAQRQIQQYIANVDNWVKTGLMTGSQGRVALGQAGVSPFNQFAGTNVGRTATGPTTGTFFDEEEDRATALIDRNF